MPLAQSGVASAAQSTVRQIGTALGIAIASTLFVSALDVASQDSLNDIDGLHPAVAAGIESSIAPTLGHILDTIEHPGSATNRDVPSHATEIISGIDEATRMDIATHIRDVSTSAARLTIGIAAGIILVGVLATLRLPRRSGHH